MPAAAATNALDRLIGWMSPGAGVKRARARLALQMLRSYEAAKVSRRTGGWRATGAAANAVIAPALSKLRDRSRECQVVAYWLFQQHPDELIARSLQSRRVPASEVLHVFEVLRRGPKTGGACRLSRRQRRRRRRNCARTRSRRVEWSDRDSRSAAGGLDYSVGCVGTSTKGLEGH